MSRGRLLGVCAPAPRSGKGAIGEILAREGWIQMGFADPVKQMAMELFNLTVDQVYGYNGYDRERELPEWGMSVRQILQQLGTEVGRSIHPDVWIRHAIRRWTPRLERGQDVVVSDLRFVNEAKAVHWDGGKVWGVGRPGYVALTDHASERDYPKIPKDHVIVNDGDLSALRVKLDDAVIRTFGV